MAGLALRSEFELETRNKYTKVNCSLNMTIDGRELPTMAVIGAALEEAVELIEKRVKESYEVVPPRASEPTTAQQHTEPNTAQPALVPVYPKPVTHDPLAPVGTPAHPPVTAPPTFG